MLQCKEVAEEASNYIDGDLSFIKRVGLFLHLLMCRYCRNYVHQLRRTIFTVSVLKPKEKDSTDMTSLAKKLHDHCHK
tara:strand:- start:76288 stop:76521 length:234 start_codon:yes stop_codon:yes gene_type:complete